MTLLLPPAYEGGGASAQQRWALRPPSLLLRPPCLAFLRLREKWSPLAERRPWLRPPARLEDKQESKVFDLIVLDVRTCPVCLLTAGRVVLLAVSVCATACCRR